MLRFHTLFSLLLVSGITLLAQDKLVIDDRSGILNEEAETLIGEKLESGGFTYTRMVDFSQRCSYYFAELRRSGNDLVINIKDCDGRMLGSKNLGALIFSSSVQEQAFLVSYNLLEILGDPGKYATALTATTDPGQTAGTEAAPAQDTALANEHNSRYFFAPSAYNLKKGELYYNTVYFLIHDIQYGFSDMFSMGMGTTIIGLPLYFTPKLSIPLGEKSALALGDMLMFGTWGTDFMGNLAYGTFSYGGSDGNITLGAGHLYTSENDLTGRTSSLVSNFSAMTRISPYIFFLTENYVMSANFNREAWFNQSSGGYYETVYEDFVQRNTFWYGIAGIRIVSKNRDFISWQMGLTYLVNFPGEIPRQYNSWEHNAREDMNMIAFPTVSMTIKFGKHF